MDGSDEDQYQELKYFTDQYSFCNHVHLKQEVFNKPALLNYAIKNSDADYIIASDADYIFKRDFLSTYDKFCGPQKMLLKEVQMMPHMNITLNRIHFWQFDKYKLNRWGKLANGAAQCATREYFLNNPYNEQMEKLGGMDNLAVYTAEKKGLDISWITESVILHQFHPISSMKWDDQFNKNQQIIKDELKRLNG